MFDEYKIVSEVVIERGGGSFRTKALRDSNPVDRILVAALIFWTIIQIQQTGASSSVKQRFTENQEPL